MKPISPEQMYAAYQILLEMDVDLKEYANSVLVQNYGKRWEHILSLERSHRKLQFRELLSLYEEFPPLDKCFTESEFHLFCGIVKVREKVANMRTINEDELNRLNKCKDLVDRLKVIKN